MPLIMTAIVGQAEIRVHTKDNPPSQHDRLDRLEWDKQNNDLQAFRFYLEDDLDAVMADIVFSSRNGMQTIPGNHTLTEYIDEDSGQPYYDFPVGWEYHFSNVNA